MKINSKNIKNKNKYYGNEESNNLYLVMFGLFTYTSTNLHFQTDKSQLFELSFKKKKKILPDPK